MKIICAGLSKTGTKSLNAALTTLGFTVYDVLEHYEILGEQWSEIFQIDGDVSEKLRAMYSNVDAACDSPIYGYWEDMLKAFPDAKVILLVRDDWKSWYYSMVKQVEKMNSKIFPLLTHIFSPTMRSFMSHASIPVRSVFGHIESSRFKTSKFSLLKMKRAYNQHIAYVKQVCPADQLLVFNCQEGWEPLCKFLQLPIPTSPFPHKNVGGKVIEELLLPSGTFRKIRQEVVLRMAMTCITFLGIWRLVHHGITPAHLFDSVKEIFMM